MNTLSAMISGLSTPECWKRCVHLKEMVQQVDFSGTLRQFKFLANCPTCRGRFKKRSSPPFTVAWFGIDCDLGILFMGEEEAEEGAEL